jgi:hypothetical protein
MPRIPIYQRQVTPGVGVPQARFSAGPGVDFTPIARGLSDIAQAVGRREDIDAREQQQRAAEMQRAIQEQQRNEAMVLLAEKVSEGRQAFTERIAQAKLGADEAAAGLTEAVLKDFTKWQEDAERAVPAVARPVLKQRLAALRTEVHSEAFGYEMGARYRGIERTYVTGLDSDRRTVAVNPSAMPETAAQRLAILKTLALPADLKARLKQKTIDELATDAALGLVEREPEQVLQVLGFDQYSRGGKRRGRFDTVDADQVADLPQRVAQHPILGFLPPEKLDTVLSRAKTLAGQRQAAIEAQQAAARAVALDRVRGVVDMLRDGFDPDPRELIVARQVAAGTEWAPKLAQAQAEAQVAQDFRGLPLAQQRQELDAVRTKVGTPEGARLFQRLERLHEDARTRINQDPLSYGSRMLGLPAVPFEAAGQNWQQQLAARVPQAMTVSTWTGQPASPLRKDEAHALADTLNALPLPQRVASIRSIAAAVPDPAMQRALVAQMGDKDQVLALAMAAGTHATTRGRTLSELILRGADAEKTGAMKDGQALSVDLGDIARRIDQVQWSSQKARDAALQASVLVYKGLRADGRRSVDQAVELATGGIMEHNGARITRPWGWSEDDTRRALARGRSAEVLREMAGGDAVTVNGNPVPVQLLAEQWRDVTLRNYGEGAYAVLSGGAVVMRPDGRPFLFRVQP